MKCDRLTAKLAKIRKEVGNYTAVVRVTKKGVSLMSIRSKYDNFEDDDQAAEVAALKKLNRSASQRKASKPNYFG